MIKKPNLHGNKNSISKFMYWLKIYVLNCYSNQIGKYFFHLKYGHKNSERVKCPTIIYFTQNWFQEHYMIIVNSTSKNKSFFLKRDFKWWNWAGIAKKCKFFIYLVLTSYSSTSLITLVDWLNV